MLGLGGSDLNAHGEIRGRLVFWNAGQKHGKLAELFQLRAANVATFQVLPLYQRYADLNPALRAFGAPAILLVWLYVMANVIVFGAELNWWLTRRAEQRQEDELPGLA